MVCHPLNHKQLTGDPVSCFFCKPQWSKFLLTLRTYWCSSSASALWVSPSEIVSLLPPSLIYYREDTLPTTTANHGKGSALRLPESLPPYKHQFCGPPRWQSSNLRPLFSRLAGTRSPSPLDADPAIRPTHGAACPVPPGHLYPALFAAWSTAPPPEGPHRTHSRLQREKTRRPVMAGHLRVDCRDIMGQEEHVVVFLSHAWCPPIF